MKELFLKVEETREIWFNNSLERSILKKVREWVGRGHHILIEYLVWHISTELCFTYTIKINLFNTLCVVLSSAFYRWLSGRKNLRLKMY
jgi:hypothetical protein